MHPSSELWRPRNRPVARATVMQGSGIGLVGGAVLYGGIGLGVSYLLYLLWGWIHRTFGWPGSIIVYGGLPALAYMYTGSQVDGTS